MNLSIRSHVPSQGTAHFFYVPCLLRSWNIDPSRSAAVRLRHDVGRITEVRLWGVSVELSTVMSFRTPFPTVLVVLGQT